jgi:subtilase family serine protease
MQGTLREKVVETLQCGELTPVEYTIVLKETCRMQTKPKRLRTLIATLLSVALLLAIGRATLPVQGPARVAASPGIVPSDQVFQAHTITVRPEIRTFNPDQDSRSQRVASSPRHVRYACQSNINPRPVLCYGPYQIRAAYGVSGLLARQITGHGATIAIIDAYGSPTIRKDLQTFTTAWGLPQGHLNIFAPSGIQGSSDPWVSETSLDVEWAHAMAPGATINLVVARTSNDVDLYKALAYAVRHELGDIISLSFGENEHCIDPRLRSAEHRTFKEAVGKGISVLVATGDYGSVQMSCSDGSYQQAVSYPAADPLVTAVGGTALTADAVSGRYIGETAWNESGAFSKATGGGYSRVYAAPGYQKRVRATARGRGVPDLALNASVFGGVLVYDHDRLKNRTTVSIMGGTSVATPELAGILADGVQLAHHRLGALNPLLYRLGRSKVYNQVMHDISSGNNMLASSGLSGYAAAPGWDPATGWGSPRQTEAFLRALAAG